MKQLTLLFALTCFFFTGYGQYFPGQRFVGPGKIPGLLTQLKNNPSNSQKANLLLDLGYGYLCKAGEAKEDLDSALHYSLQLTDLSTRLNNATWFQESLLLRSMIHMEQKDFAASESIMPGMSDTMRLKILLCLSIFTLNTPGASADDVTYVDSASHYIQPAVMLTIKTRIQQEKIAQILEQIGWMYRSRHLVSQAEKQYMLMMKCSDSTGYPGKARVLSNLSVLYNVEGNFYKAKNYGFQAEKALNSNSSDEDVSNVYLSQGNAYAFQDKPEQVLHYYGLLLAAPHKYGRFMLMYSILASYCGNLQKLGRYDEVLPYLQKFQQRFPVQTDYDRCFYHAILANYYKDKKQYEPAEKNYLEAIRYADAVKNRNGAFYHNLGALYYQNQAYEKAAAALKTAEEKLPVENYLIVARNYLYISLTEAALGHHEKAYQYITRSKTITDSLYTTGKARLTEELETQYKTQERIEALRNREENIYVLNQEAGRMKQAAMWKDAALKEAALLSQKDKIALDALALKAKNAEVVEKNYKLQQAASAVRRTITYLVIGLMAVIVLLMCWLFWSKLKSNKVITQKNELLQQLVKDKSWLLKEMHHRVKNNLHTIVSLLEFQSTYLHDDALEAIRHSQSRIFSMSLIHQKLYQTDDNRTIDMTCYIPELVDYLKESFSTHRPVHITMDIDPTTFQVEEAVPLGLIINEAVTNSMKYAFRRDQPGEIKISLKAGNAGDFELVLADNGEGLKEGFDLDNVTSLGFQLIKGLTEQLDAQLHIANENGLKIIVAGISACRTGKAKAMEKEIQEQPTT